MNTFRRVDGDDENPSLLDDTVQHCRTIAWEVLGPLDVESLRKLCVWNDGEREAKIWGIGHW